MKRLILVAVLSCLVALPAAVLAAPVGPESENGISSAPLGITDPPVISAAQIADTHNTGLSWEHVLEASFYEIYRGTAPYFDPSGAGEGNRINEVPGSGAGTTISVTDDGVDYYAADGTMGPVQVLGVPATNYFWVVRSRTANGSVSELSNRLGEFDYALWQGN